MKAFWMVLFICVPLIAYGGNLAPDDGVPVINLPYEKVAASPGFEERGPEFVKWLASSVRIGGASGTMVYYDGEWMYILSAGHLFGSGYSKTKRSVNFEIFYQGDKKLNSPKRYTGELLCKVWGNEVSRVYDVSLIRFKPDWSEAAQQVASIAPLDYKLEPGRSYHSVGCDGMSEPAHYLVEYVEERQNGGVTEIVTRKNGPRGGRSGGGVFTDDGQLIMVCSRGDGYMGIWTSLNQIHKFLKDEGYGFILQGSAVQARSIPVVDVIFPERKYPSDYIPIPGK